MTVIKCEKREFWKIVKEADFQVCDYQGHKRVSFYNSEYASSRRDGGGFFGDNEEVETIPAVLESCFFQNDDRLLAPFCVSTEYEYELEFSRGSVVGALVTYKNADYPVKLYFFNYKD